MSDEQENEIQQENELPQSADISVPIIETKGINFAMGASPDDNGNYTTLNASGSIGSEDGLHASASANYTDGNLNYSLDASSGVVDVKGIETNAAIHHDNSDTSVSIGAERHLINMDNINNTNDQYQERKEELQESGEQFSLQSKVGYSQEQNSLYTENSLMYRINNDTFLTGTYTQNKDNLNAALTADLRNIKLDYNYTDSSEQTQHTFNFENKNPQIHYNGNVSLSSISQGEEGNLHNVSFGAGAVFNRTEYGEFQPGFSGAIDTAMTLSNGSVSGYHIGLDGSYNRYGETDFLMLMRTSLEKQDSNTSFSASLSGAYRINNERTIFEPKIEYNSNSGNGISDKTLSSRLGYYQQVGKNYGDASIYLVGEAGKKWTSQNGIPDNTPFAGLYGGLKVKPTKKLSLDTKISYSTDTKFGGEIGVTYNF